MLKVTSLTLLCGSLMAASVFAAPPLTFEPVRNRPSASQPATVSVRQTTPTFAAKPFALKDATGKVVSIPLADESDKRKLVGPIAKIDPKLNPTLARAATIAQERANAHSKSRCWRYVKEALLAAGAVDSYPKTALAKQAGDELVQNYGFKKLPVNNPYAAPIGAVLVYTAKGAGHVEIRTKTGFVSDFKAPKPSKRKLIGVYAKA
ncbi:MAG: hypothetical protein ABIR71_10730 [Chthoniobacterales bacterium]